MSFKRYLKTNKLFVISCIVIILFMLLVPMESISLGDTFIGKKLFSLIISASLIAIIIGDYRHQNQLCIQCKKIYDKKIEMYKNFNYDKFIDLVYEDNVLDLDLIGCPDNISEKEKKKYIKNYILNLKNPNNN